jgi:hypothetical protein
LFVELRGLLQRVQQAAAWAIVCQIRNRQTSCASAATASGSSWLCYQEAGAVPRAAAKQDELLGRADVNEGFRCGRAAGLIVLTFSAFRWSMTSTMSTRASRVSMKSRGIMMAA